MTERPPTTVLHLDDDLVVVSKPGGLLVHRSELSPERDVLLQRVRDQLGRRIFPVHRLDRATSGPVVFALSPEIVRALQERWHHPETEKVYLALVRGESPDRFESDRPLTRRPDGVRQDARTECTTRATDRGFSLVEARLRTGRRHQIRRHLAHLGHQVVGDTTYGKGRINAWLREEYGLPRLFLHQTRLRFAHPRDGTIVTVDEPLPPDLARFLDRFSAHLAAAAGG